MAKQSVQQNEGNGFKTVAFGFDKNDVTLYIGALRKKMTAAEQEYEDKISQLEIKLKNANSAVNYSQQDSNKNNQADAENKAKIDELTAQVEALKQENQRLAAEAAEKDSSISELNAQLSKRENVTVQTEIVASGDAEQIVKIAYEHINELNKAAEQFKKKLETLKIEEANAAPDAKEVHIEEEPKAEIEAAPAVEKAVEAVEENPAEPSMPAAASAIDDYDFADLLAESDDNDLSSDIDISIKPDEDIDLMQLLAEDKTEEKGEDLVPTEPKNDEQKGSDLGNDLYEILINPEDSGTDLFDLLEEKKEADNAENKELEIKPAEIDKTLEITNEFSDLLAVDKEPAAMDSEWTAHEQMPKKAEDEMFDFAAFAPDDEQSDDDMSTNVMPNLF